MVLDRVNKVAYACESPRTNRTVLEDFCKQLGYSLVFSKLSALMEQKYITQTL